MRAGHASVRAAVRPRTGYLLLTEQVHVPMCFNGVASPSRLEQDIRGSEPQGRNPTARTWHPVPESNRSAELRRLRSRSPLDGVWRS